MPYSAAYKRRFAKANRLRKEGDAQAAIKVLRGLITEFPEKAAAYLVIGDILWDAGKLPAASRAFRVATKLFPKLKIASLGLFHTLWEQSKTDAAFGEMKRFQRISFCRDYEEIVDEILQKD
jgi:predicted Zn-dependent protease